jgi:hypothetical protein
MSQSQWTFESAPSQPTPIESLKPPRQFIEGYVLPADEAVTDRQDYQHILLGRFFASRGAFCHYFAPLPNLAQPHETLMCLDVGAASGIWLRDYARLLARLGVRAQFYGIDRVRPNEKYKAALPPHVHLQFGDIRERQNFQDNLFTHVHQRMLTFGIKRKEWPQVIAELFRVTKPGGWIELMEITGELPGAPFSMGTLLGWAKQMAWTSLGVDLTAGRYLASMLQQWVGCVNLQWATYNVPMGAWGGHVGNLAKLDVLTLFDEIKKPIAAAGIASIEEVEQTIAYANWELDQPGIMCNLQYRVAIGQKPQL